MKLPTFPVSKARRKADREECHKYVDDLADLMKLREGSMRIGYMAEIERYTKIIEIAQRALIEISDVDH